MRELVTIAETNDTQSFSDGARKYFRMPGKVIAFYPGVKGVSPPAVDVQPGVHDVRFDTTTGARYSEPWPIQHKVPVKFPSGGGFAIWWDLKAGDAVDLESFDLDPGPFLASGQPSDPALTRRNGGAHWVAIPGDYTDPAALPPAGGALCFGSPGGVLVTVTSSGVNLGAAAPTDAVALASVVDAILNGIVQSVNALGSSPLTGTSLATALQLAWGGTPTAPTTPPVTTASKTIKATP